MKVLPERKIFSGFGFVATCTLINGMETLPQRDAITEYLSGYVRSLKKIKCMCVYTVFAVACIMCKHHAYNTTGGIHPAYEILTELNYN